MTFEDTMSALQPVFADVFRRKDLTVGPETSAADVPGWDSLSHLNLVVAVEQRFGVTFSTGEVRRLKNVGDLARLVGAKLSK